MALAARGYEVACIENLCIRGGEVMKRRATITGKPIPSEVGDAHDTAALQQDAGQHGIEAVIQFAGLKAVGEAGAEPVTHVDVAACCPRAMKAGAEMEREDRDELDDMVASRWLFEEMPTGSEAA
ncbi:hypothetical protein GCM10011617_00060 [Novosphingobium arvoryzae]|uniref:Uncharacterized protein n=1 Tax=Novosphingobium arvoryzae TaxID=1256514 RepID=A0A918VAN3_9SPHN|nr:hypothetical protein [Novosphingobium arvoryzae]GGZ85654.1 hypothetical protein GCM10011617_00060 [Novosphingobium arvoryzae]